MKIGIFTDTYFPQISGVATSVRILKEQLEKLGNEVYLFTTTDKNANTDEEEGIIRLPSVPFISFKERRMIYRGFWQAYRLAKAYDLDIIHTQTEFGVGILGKMIARAMKIPILHTYHTQYEDYVKYIAKGLLVRPGMVKYIVRSFMHDLDGVICPSEIVQAILCRYGVSCVKRVIPTGIEVDRFIRPEISSQEIEAVREKLHISPQETMLLSLSRVSYEKNIQALIKNFPLVLVKNPLVKLVIVGGGPYQDTLVKMTEKLGLSEQVIFTGMILPEQTALYYKAADFFISASTSETQGLTYIESIASGTPIIAHHNPYLDKVVDHQMFGFLFEKESDLADTILYAINHRLSMTDQEWSRKLFEVSAENFGLKVYQYYLDVMISKQFDYRYERRRRNPVRSVGRLSKRSLVATKYYTRKSIRVVKRPVDYFRNKND